MDQEANEIHEIHIVNSWWLPTLNYASYLRNSEVNETSVDLEEERSSEVGLFKGLTVHVAPEIYIPTGRHMLQ